MQSSKQDEEIFKPKFEIFPTNVAESVALYIYFLRKVWVISCVMFLLILQPNSVDDSWIS